MRAMSPSGAMPVSMAGSVAPVRAPEGAVIDWDALRPKGWRGVLPRRWVAERTFSWLGQSRRLSKDYERLCETGEALIYATMTRLMARRLARR